MEISILIAKMMALVYVVMGLGFAIHTKYFKKSIDGMMDSGGVMIFGGVFALITGFLLVNFHNIWVTDWPIIITIIGWMGLLKGVLIFLTPDTLLKFSKFTFNMFSIRTLGICALIFGLMMGYFGYCI